MPPRHILENKIHTHTLTALLDGGGCLILRCCSFIPIKELPISVEKDASWAPERSGSFGNKNLLLLPGLKPQIVQPVVTTRLGTLFRLFFILFSLNAPSSTEKKLKQLQILIGSPCFTLSTVHTV
jgi:hypothetical protein